MSSWFMLFCLFFTFFTFFFPFFSFFSWFFSVFFITYQDFIFESWDVNLPIRISDFKSWYLVLFSRNVSLLETFLRNNGSIHKRFPIKNVSHQKRFRFPLVYLIMNHTLCAHSNPPNPDEGDHFVDSKHDVGCCFVYFWPFFWVLVSSFLCFVLSLFPFFFNLPYFSSHDRISFFLILRCQFTYQVLRFHILLSRFLFEKRFSLGNVSQKPWFNPQTVPY